MALTAALLLYPDAGSVLMPGGFAAGFSPLHLFWAMWMVYLITKILPWRRLHNHSEFRQFAASFRARVPFPDADVIRKHSGGNR